MRKLVSIFIFIILVFCILPFEVHAAQYDTTYENVFDYANLLSSTEEKNLSDIAKNYETQYDVHVIFLTYDDANGKSTMRYTDDFYDGLYYDDDGILFAIDMDNREGYINTVGKCIDALSDNERETVFDRTFNYLSNGKYYNFLKYSSENAFSYMVSGGVIDSSSNSYYDDDYSNDTYYDDDTEEDASWYLPTQGSLLISFFVMVFVGITLIVQHNKANKKISATNYVAKNGYKVLDRNERFVRTYETVSHGYYRQSSSSSGGGGGSSSHRSSSGVRHGGGGRRF